MDQSAIDLLWRNTFVRFHDVASARDQIGVIHNAREAFANPLSRFRPRWGRGEPFANVSGADSGVLLGQDRAYCDAQLDGPPTIVSDFGEDCPWIACSGDHRPNIELLVSAFE
jgi:hypothetical protein